MANQLSLSDEKDIYSSKASVAVVAYTGNDGMKAAEANQYFISGSGYPDFLVFSSLMLKEGASAIKCAGFYKNRWDIDRENSFFGD